MPKTDKHQMCYIPFRCSKDIDALIRKLAAEQGRPMSEVVRDLVERGLVVTGARGEEEYLNSVIRVSLKEILAPSVERLAAISAKATQIGSAAFFMGIYAASRQCSQQEQQEIEQAAETARGLGIQYLKLKDRDLDAFIREGVKQINDE